jgi:hypothetical protein
MGNHKPPDGSVVSIGEAALQQAVVSGDTPTPTWPTPQGINNHYQSMGDWVKVTQEAHLPMDDGSN